MSAKVKKTISEINERIKAGRAVVVTAEEMTEAVRTMGKAKANGNRRGHHRHFFTHVFFRPALQHRPTRAAGYARGQYLAEQRPGLRRHCRGRRLYRRHGNQRGRPT